MDRAKRYRHRVVSLKVLVQEEEVSVECFVFVTTKERGTDSTFPPGV